MKDYLILFREPDGRMDEHAAEEITSHRRHWTDWFAKWSGQGRLAGGSALSLEGALITDDGSITTKGIHRVGTEVVGGFLLIKAESLDEASAIIASCPIFESGGYAEVREFMSVQEK
jgi:hypothetical protein